MEFELVNVSNLYLSKQNRDFHIQPYVFLVIEAVETPQPKN